MQIHTKEYSADFVCYGGGGGGGLPLDDMKDSLSLVSVSVCHISSCDDAVIIVPVHCNLLQNTPLASLQTLFSIQLSCLACLVTGKGQARPSA